MNNCVCVCVCCIEEDYESHFLRLVNKLIYGFYMKIKNVWQAIK